jgi:prepilin-type N-terminal cleavage/methylation domain-containing protein
MTMRKHELQRPTPGFTLAEVMIVLVMVGVLMAIAAPRVDFTRYRVDAAVQNVRSVLMQAQRTALLRQFDVVVSIDTAHQALKTAEDLNNDGIIQPDEHKRTYTLNDGMSFAVPPTGLDSSVAGALVGSQLGHMDGLPTIIFHRDGAATSNLELYLATPAGPARSYRALRLIRGTGRTDWYRYDSGAGTWKVGGLQ